MQLFTIAQADADDRTYASNGEGDVQAAEVPEAAFHRMIVEGLVALYLSDPRSKASRQVRKTSRLLMERSPWTRLFFWMNSLWIRKAILRCI